MRKLLISLTVVLISTTTYAQQDAHYTQFMYNKQLLNPGFTGARRVPSVAALYRNQWIGYDGHPRSYLVSFDAALDKKRLGAGLIMSNQSEGIINRNMGNLSLSYDIVHTEKTTLRIGMSGTLREYRFDLGNPEVYIKERQDATLSKSNTPKLVNANVGGGIYFDNKTFYVGVSVPNLMKNPIYLTENNNVNTGLLGQEKRHIYIMAGGFFQIFDNADLHLKPSAMFKYVKNAPFSLDANLSVMVKKAVMGGISYRYGGKYSIGDTKSGGGDSIDLLAYFQATSQLGIGAAYDFTLSQLSQHTKGTIEFVGRYDFVGEKKILRNPRYFF